MNTILKNILSVLIFTAIFSYPIGYCEQTESNLSIPASIGSITCTDDDISASDRLIIHILDSHCNNEVQKNISKIIELIIKNNNIELIGIEGASGDINTEIFASFPDDNAKSYVCKNYTKNGFLTGVENFSICKDNDRKISLWGLEDISTYYQNLTIFRNTQKAASSTLNAINILQATADDLKIKIYPQALLSFDSTERKYLSHDLNLTGWIQYLKNYTDEKNIPFNQYQNINKFIDIVSIEKDSIDYAQITLEKNNLLNTLKEALPEQEFKQIAENNLNYFLGHISEDDYFSFISKYITKQAYPNLKAFTELKKLQNSLDKNLLNNELEQLTKSIKDFIIKDITSGSDQHETITTLDQISESLYLLEKLATLSITDKEYLSYEKSKKKYPLDKILNFLENFTEQYKYEFSSLPQNKISQIEDSINLAENFYKISDKRSKIMVGNLLEKMNEKQLNKSIIITGGFHSRSIQSELKNRNIPFITIKPTVTNLKNKTYNNLMTQDIIGLNSTLYLSATNLAFPVLCNMSIARGSYFANLRHRFAADLFAKHPLPVGEYENLIGDDISKNLFSRLTELAGISASQTTEQTISIGSNITPEAIVAKILTYSNKKINHEIQAMGINPQGIGTNEKEIFVNYLFELLDLSISLSPSAGNPIDYYLQIVENTNFSYKSVLHDIALYKSQIKLTTDTAYQVIQDMVKNNGLSLNDGFSPQNITIDNMYSLPVRDDGTIRNSMNFNMSFKTKDGTEKSFFVKSIIYPEIEKNGHFALDAFGRQHANYYFADIPHDNYAGYYVSEKIGDLNFSDVDVLDDNINLYAELLGKAIGEAYVIGLHDRHDDNLRITMSNGTPVSITNIDLHSALSPKHSLTASLLSITELILKAQTKELSQKQIDNILTAFFNGYTKTINELQQYYIERQKFLENYPYLKENPSWDSVLRRISPDSFSLDSHVKTILDYINKRTQLNFQYVPFEKPQFDFNSSENILPALTGIFENSPDASIYEIKLFFQSDENRYLMDTLSQIAGFTPENHSSIPINRLFANLSPGKVTEYLSGLNIASIDNMMLKNGFSADQLTDNNRKMFIKHLLKLLDITIELSMPEANKKFHLASLMKKFQDSNKVLLAESVKEQLYEEIFKDSDKITNTTTKIISGKIHNAKLQKGILKILNLLSGVIFHIDNILPKTLSYPLKGIISTVQWIKNEHLKRLRVAKSFGIKKYIQLKTSITELSEQTSTDLTDLLTDIDTIIFLMKKFNLDIGRSITINQGMLEALDLRFLSENEYLPLMKDAYQSKYKRAFYTNRRDGKNNLNTMKAMAKLLYNIPDEILEGFPKWTNRFFISDENKNIGGYASRKRVFINALNPQTDFRNASVVYHEYLGHVLPCTLIDQAFLKKDFTQLEQRLSTQDILDILSACVNLKYSTHKQVRFSLNISGANIDNILIPYDKLQKLIIAFNLNHPESPQVQLSRKTTTLSSLIKIKNMSFEFLEWARENNKELFWFLVNYDLFFDDRHLQMEYPSESFFGVSQLTKINEIIANTIQHSPITQENMFFSFDWVGVSQILQRRFTRGWDWTYSGGWNKKGSYQSQDEQWIPLKVADEQTDAPVDKTDIKTLQNFIDNNRFSAFESENTNASAQIFTSSKNSIFLKNFPQSIYSGATLKRKIRNWRANPVGIITYMLRLITTPVNITKAVQANLGDIVPPMLSLDKFLYRHINIDGKDYMIKPNAHIQTAMPYLVKDFFIDSAKQNDTEKINAIIDQYFQIQQTMWRRGFFDMDYFFYKNYGFQDINSLNMKCIDITEFTTSSTTAMFLMKFDRLYYDRLLRDLRTLIPEECVQYFDDRYKQIFTVDNFLSQWKKGETMPANRISLLFTEQGIKQDNLRNTLQNEAIISFLNETGFDDTNGSLLNKINALYNNFFVDGNTSVKSIGDILGKDIDESEFRKLCLEIFNLETPMVMPLKKMILSLGKNGHNQSGLFFMAVYKLIGDHIESEGRQRPSKLTDRLRSHQDIFAQSL